MKPKDGPLQPEEVFKKSGHLTLSALCFFPDDGIPRVHKAKAKKHMAECKKCNRELQKIEDTLSFVRKVIWNS